MYVGRILLTCGVSSGAVHAVTECILASECAGHGGFAALLEAYADLRMHAFDRIRLTDVDPRTLEVDGGENHAWILAPTLIDLAVDVARRQGAAYLRVRNLRAAGELAIVPHLARRHGAIAKVTTDESSASLEVSNGSPPRRPEQWDPLLMQALQEGYPVSESLWRNLHALSNGALAPDSVVSRRHAGPVILLDDGTVLGRQPSDDDYDPNMLKSVPPTNATAHSNPVQSS
jgi:hypothetical protein